MAFLKRFRWAVEAPDLEKYVGRSVKITDPKTGKEKVVEIMRVVGNLAKPTDLQVTVKDGEDYVISMLDFFAQMNGEKVTKEEIEAFNDTLFEMRELPKKINGIWRPGGNVRN